MRSSAAVFSKLSWATQSRSCDARAILTHMGRLGAERRAQFERFGYSPKNAAHCVRLLRMGLELAETGEMHVDRTNIDAEELKAIKRGEWSLADIDAVAGDGLERLRVVEERSDLPPEPDYGEIEDLLMLTTQTLWSAYDVPVWRSDLFSETPRGSCLPGVSVALQE